MKKILTKIVGLALGLTMALGVGVGIASNKKANPVYAASYQWELVTSAPADWSGQYILCNDTSGTVKMMDGSTFSSSSCSGVDVTVSDNRITADDSDALTIAKSSTNGKYTIVLNGKFIGKNANSNGIDANDSWSSSLDNAISYSSGKVVIAGNGGRVLTWYASNSNFRYYASSNNSSQLYKKVESGGGDSEKADVALTCDDFEIDIADDPTAVVVTTTSGGEPVSISPLSYVIANPSIATVSSSGVITPVSLGETTLTISYAGNEDYNEASITIAVVVSDRTLHFSDLTFTAACGGSGIADDGAAWTVESDGAESTFASDGIHYGTNSAEVTYVELTTSGIVGNIERVAVTTRDAQAVATISVSVGDTAFTCSGSATATNTSAEYVFTGNARGEIVVRIDRGSSQTKAIYVKSVKVTYRDVSLLNITLSGSYPIVFTQGDDFSHEGMVVTANYSDSTSEVVTSSATWTGYNMASVGEQTVTVSYTNPFGTVSKTYGITVNAPVDPTIVLSIYSVSGYTGEEFSVQASFANLNSAFAWGSPSGTGSISGSVTASTGTSTDGTSTFSGTLTGAGSVTLTTSGGGVAEAPSVTFTITGTTVSLNKNATIISQGESETLVATTNVGGVNWSSNNAKVTVSNGVVTVAADAVVASTATITATSTLDGSVSATCLVTVAIASVVYEVTFGTAEGNSGISNFNNSSYVIPSGVTLSNIQGNLYSNTSNQAASIRFGKNGATGSFDVTVDANYYIKKVIANLKYYSSDTDAVFAVTPAGGSAIEKTMTSSFANYEYDISASCSNKATLGTTINSKRAFLSGFTVVCQEKTSAQKVETNMSTVAGLRFDYVQNGVGYDYSEIGIRFGGFISQDLWSDLNSESTIQGYGVVVAETSALGGQTIKQKYEAAEGANVDAKLSAICNGSTIKKISVAIPGDKDHPAEASDDQIDFLGAPDGDYYIWTVRKVVAIGNLDTSYTAVAYIKTAAGIVFLQQTAKTARGLAELALPIVGEGIYKQPINKFIELA